jgi:hypothetical protein
LTTLANAVDKQKKYQTQYQINVKRIPKGQFGDNCIVFENFTASIGV